uniref:Uncharacterized protein n=1 Tax=Panagrolaimus sp. ES5 TaxID=591445 RepID=A0AC34GEK1_9BILA
MIQPMQAYQYAMQYAVQNKTPYAKSQVNEVKNSSLETTAEEVNSELSRDIANCVVSAKSVASQPHEDTKALPTEVVAAQKNDRVSLMQEYERKLDEFLTVPEILEEISNKVYNRKFMQHLRDIIRDFHTTPCPLSEQELKRIGIDRATMHQPVNVSHKSKYQERRGDNKKFWRPDAQPRGNIRWPNDSRENQNVNRQIKPQITSRSPVRNQKFATLIRGPNAWLSEVMKAGNVVDPNSVEARIAKIKKDVQGILNKITPTTAADLSIEMINKCVWRDEDSLPAVIELFFTKAIGEPKYVE